MELKQRISRSKSRIKVLGILKNLRKGIFGGRFDMQANIEPHCRRGRRRKRTKGHVGLRTRAFQGSRLVESVGGLRELGSGKIQKLMKRQPLDLRVILHVQKAIRRVLGTSLGRRRLTEIDRRFGVDVCALLVLFWLYFPSPGASLGRLGAS